MWTLFIVLWLMFVPICAVIAAGTSVVREDGTRASYSPWLGLLGLFFGPFGLLCLGAYISERMPDGTPRVAIGYLAPRGVEQRSARRAHHPEVAGSSPAPAPNTRRRIDSSGPWSAADKPRRITRQSP